MKFITNELKSQAKRIEDAMCPEDIFGMLADEKYVKLMYHNLAREVHPDLQQSVEGKELAETTFVQLVYLYTHATERLKDGTYGKKITVPNRVPVIIGGRYVSEKPLTAGDIADLHLGCLESSAAHHTLILKVARLPEDNSLMEREAKALKVFADKESFQNAVVKDAVPKLYSSFLLGDGVPRRVNVLGNCRGFINGKEVRERFTRTKGVDGRTIAWMWKRVLVALDWTHHLGLLHGAVLPPHLLFYPDNDGTTNPRDPRKHSIRLVDWCYSINPTERTKLKAYVPEFKDLYAPEILKKELLTTATDIYMAAQTMLYLSNGDLPKPLRDTIETCLHQDYKRRPHDAGAHFHQVHDAVSKTYGPRKWHEFVVPGI